MPIAGSNDVLVFSDSGPKLPRAALKRTRADGTVAWVVLPPDSQHSWVSASIAGGIVTAHSWSCSHVNLDLESGQKVERVFTK